MNDRQLKSQRINR